MRNIPSNKLLLAVIASVFLGALLGYLFPGLMLGLAFLGQLFVNILQIIFFPLVAAAIITGVSTFTNYRQTSRATLATISVFIGTTVAAVLIALIVVSIIKPGVGADTGAAYVPQEVTQVPISQSLDFLAELMPANIINAVSHGKFLGWMIGLVVVAVILAGLGRKARPVTAFFETIHEVVLKLLAFVIRITPIGIFFLTGAIVARNSGYIASLGSGLTKFSITLLIALLLHAVVVIPLLIKIIGRRQPLEYFRNIVPALSAALASASPTAALPITYENSRERNKVGSSTAGLVLPLGTSLNVDGRALYVVIGVVFVAQAYGLDLGLTGMLYVGAATLLFSLGTATVPFAGMLTMVAVFDAVGFPSSAYAGIGLLFVVDWFWGRMFAAVDVWSDAGAAAAVEEMTVSETVRPIRFTKRTERTLDRPRTRRESPARMKRVERKRDERRPERKRSPVGRPEREPVTSSRSYPTRKPADQKRGHQQQRAASSPFDIKPESAKAFDPETARASERPTFGPKPRPSEEKLSPSEAGRRTREKKHASPARKKPLPKDKPQPSKLSETSTPASKPEIKRTVVPPPPLIREIEKTAKEDTPAPEKVEPVTAPESPEESGAAQQAVRFGRSARRKGPRPKADATPPEPKEEPEFSSEEQKFGRARKKKERS